MKLKAIAITTALTITAIAGILKIQQENAPSTDNAEVKISSANKKTTEAQNPSSICTTALPCPIKIYFSLDPHFQEIAIRSFAQIILNNNVQVLTPEGDNGNIVSLEGNIDLGNHVKVGNIFAGNSINTLGDAIISGEQFTLNSRNENPPPSNKNIPQFKHLDWNLSFTEISKPLPLQNEYAIVTPAPEHYADAHIKKGQTLTLTTGIYYFDSLTVDTDAVIQLENATGTVIVNIRDEFEFSGIVTSDYRSSDLLITYAGDKAVRIHSSLDASLLASNADVNFLAPKAGKKHIHRGNYLAQSISVANNNTFISTPISQQGSAFKTLSAEVFQNERDSAGESGNFAQQELFPDTKMGKELTNHVTTMYAYGPDAEENYQKSLESLREHASEALQTLKDQYFKTPISIETQQYRWMLVQMMGAIGTEHSLELLDGIAQSPVSDITIPKDMENQLQHYDIEGKEYQIRARAVEGIANLVKENISGAEEKLFNLIRNSEDLTQRYAVSEYLNIEGNRGKVEKISTLLSEDQQYLLTLDTDITTADTLQSPLDKESFEDTLEKSIPSYTNNNAPSNHHEEAHTNAITTDQTSPIATQQ